MTDNFTGKKLSHKLIKALDMLEEATVEISLLTDEVITHFPPEDKNNTESNIKTEE